MARRRRRKSVSRGRYKFTAARRRALRKAQLASARKRSRLKKRVSSHKKKRRSQYKVGEFDGLALNKKTGRITQQSLDFYDSKRNRGKRRRRGAVGAAIGTAIVPGAGTILGYHIGVQRASVKYGITTRKRPKKRKKRR